MFHLRAANQAREAMREEAELGVSGADEALDLLLARPFVLSRPRPQSVPFVFASPHSGRLYPDSLTRTSALDELNLRQSEDAFVDELFGGVVALGAPLIAAQFPRAYVDANRAENEVDPAMFDAVPAMALARTPRVAAGLGVIPRLVRDGLEIYRMPIPAREASFRLEAFYRPYHAALAKLAAETRDHFGACVVIDCHSMPSNARAPDIVIGDHYGETADAAVVERARSALRASGFTVGYNTPYAGGYTTLEYGRPDDGIHALQLEINRGLYLGEEKLEKLSSFGDCKNRIGRFVAQLIEINAEALMRKPAAQRERA